MSSVLGGLGSLAAKSSGEAVAFGLGFALGRALEPAGVEIAQEAWKLAPIRAPDAGTLAEGVAQAQVDPGQAAEWAKEHGYDSAAFDALVSIANTGPALGYAYQAWRRGELTDVQFRTALKRTGLEEQWYDAMVALRDTLLDPGALATAIHRGIIAGQGLLIAEPPAGAGKVPQVPQSTIDALTEASGQGISKERLRVLVGNTGLPLALGEMLRLLNMGDVEEDDVRRSIAQSNVRNEYMDVALALRRRLLTPREYAEAELRGVLATADARAGAGLSGVTPEDYATLFQTVGRPLNYHAITTGLARGGKYGGSYDDVPDPVYRDAIRRSNVRPEYASLAYANRYTLPSAFVLRSLVQGGELTSEDGHQLLLDLGWPPELAKKVADAWSGGTTSADKHVAKAENQLWTALHKSYIEERTSDEQANADLLALGVDAAAIPQVVKLWQTEREVVRRSLTVKQIKDAIGQTGKDAAWARERLAALGYSDDDITTLLAE